MAGAVARLTALLLTLCLAPSLAAAPSASDAKARLDAIGEAIQGVSRRLADTRAARDEADEALRRVETALATTHRHLDRLQAERRGLDDDIAELTRHRAALSREQREQREAIHAQLDALYRLGPSPQLKLLLTQDAPARLDRLQHYLNALARARHERLDRLDELEMALADNRAALDRREARLDALATELAERSAELASRRQQRAELVASLEDRYASEQARLESLNQDRAHAERVLGDIRAKLARLERPPPSTAIDSTRGALPWPVKGSVTSHFHRSRGVHRNGMLIEAAEGSPVTAVHPGRVVFADWMRGFGNLVIVDHGDQVMTLHAHLQHFTAEVGQAVADGDILGAVGATGGQGRPGLYFEVRRDGEPVDPASWVAAR